MSLNSYTFFSILVNGSPSTTLSSFDEIWKGYPLYSLLFILMYEGLYRVLKVVVIDNKIKGLKFFKDDLPISHHQFVDDTVLMGIHVDPKDKDTKKIPFEFMESSSTSVS
jgi:hypothetical protein